jgi:hypothetical protein
MGRCTVGGDHLRRRPGLKVLFATAGYTRNAIVHHGRLAPGVRLLAEPSPRPLLP